MEKILNIQGVDLLKGITEKHIVIDGKKIKGASPKSRGNDGLYILNAWVSGLAKQIKRKSVFSTQLNA